MSLNPKYNQSIKSNTSHIKTNLHPPLSIFFFQFVFKIKMKTIKIVLNGTVGGVSMGLSIHAQPLPRSQIMHFMTVQCLELAPGWWWEVLFCELWVNFHINFMYPVFKEYGFQLRIYMSYVLLSESREIRVFSPGKCLHYENTPIHIYWKFHLQKLKIFRQKSLDIFHISAQNIDCGYSLEPPVNPSFTI